MAFMTNKDIHIALKRNDGVQYLMKHFGFTTEEELFKAIRRISPLGAEDFIRKLKKQRKARKNMKEFQVVEPAEVAETVETAEPAEVVETTENSCDEISVIIKELKKQEKELSSDVCALEGVHKSLANKRRGLMEQLAEAKSALEELLKELSLQKQNVANIYTEYNLCAEEMARVNEQRKNLKEQLESVRTQITELKKVTLFIYQNGDIEIEEGKPVQISNEEVISTFNHLICYPEAGTLTVNEIRAVAKLREMVKAYQANEILVELFFDSLAVQAFWETIIA